MQEPDSTARGLGYIARARDKLARTPNVQHVHVHVPKNKRDKHIVVARVLLVKEKLPCHVARGC